jgi:hypothetical protein
MKVMKGRGKSRRREKRKKKKKERKKTKVPERRGHDNDLAFCSVG